MPLFSGSQDDVMSFNDFLHMYDDLVGNNAAYSNSAKLMYLKSYLRGNALDTIKHLSNDEQNYALARKFLTEEYLDTDIIVEEHIRKLHNLKSPSAKDFPAIRAFFNTARASVYELKAFGYNALEDDTLGSKIVSFMICEKLPTNFKLKLSSILQTDFPSTKQLMDNYNTVINKQHISAVCVNTDEQHTMLQSGLTLMCNNINKGQTVILPSMSVIMHVNDQKTCELVRCMIDYGSQASYISEDLARKLGFDLSTPKTCFNVKTCIGVKELSYSSVTCDVIFTPDSTARHTFLVDPAMNLEYEVPGIKSLVEHLQANGARLADSFFNDITSDTVGDFDCLLGSDIIGALKPLKTVDLALGTALEIEHLFSVESLGIKESDESISAQEKRLVDSFTEEVEFKDGKYFVKVPFYDIVSQVPTNYDVAFATMKKVRQKLIKRQLADSYTAVFEQQLRDGIIEEINPKEPTSNQRVFIPHHPVVKTDEQTTTKIRPVFNCSLKTSNQPSLNEACFGGIDLLNDLVQLLMRFRTNNHVLLADIEKAFLQIYLKYEEDKDRFCFLWETDDGMKMYRFRTILFGLNCSPFILNHIIQLHLQKYEHALAAIALKESLYVDNFIFTTSNQQKLVDIYEDARQIMNEGGFNLRSWMSNHPSLVDIMTSEGTLHQHEAPAEKVLGYMYDTKQDEMILADFIFEEKDHSITKRQLLSNISKIFDPLSLVLPVTIRGRLLMKKVWKDGTAWDEDVSLEVYREWMKLKEDLNALRDLKFQEGRSAQKTTNQLNSISSVTEARLATDSLAT
ncbi:hypothetical protein FJT64_003138 [Amphibalanus amphitrite]|uniref:Reverse transcriptase domain-containing protein n=1 Tax=Amphibalanus amphitrite TaxID=1232801 RepID=A0A6A4WCI8_AMPAM|nr:hypothetical protein FJT64_003138 [Amphibalanus amphitrite]